MTIKHKILILALIMIVNNIYSQNPIEKIIFGKSTLCSQKGITAINKNISGLSNSDNLKLIIGTDQTYTIPELWNVSASYIPKITKNGMLPITVACRGPGGFLKLELKAGYSQSFSRYFSAGIRLLTDYYFIKGSQNMINAGFEIGALYSINKKASVGIFYSMPGLLHNTGENGWKNMIIETAFTYYLFDKASVNFGIRKEQYTNLEVIVSISCQLFEKTSLFLAYNSGNHNIASGITLAFNKFRIVMIAEINFKIGVTPEIQMVF